MGAGSDGGRANETLHDYEIDACPYLAPDEVTLSPIPTPDPNPNPEPNPSSNPNPTPNPDPTPNQELDPRGGHELALAAIRESRDNGRKITLVLFSALTDMAALLRDPRWDELRTLTLTLT